MQGTKSHQVAAPAEPNDLPHTHRGQHRVAPKLLAGVNIAHMHLNHRQPDRLDGVVQGIAGMGESSRIEHDAISPVHRLMQRVHQCPLVVGLKHPQVDALPTGVLHKLGVYLVKTKQTVDRWLALAQEIEVGSVQHKDGGHTNITPSVSRVGANPGEGRIIIGQPTVRVKPHLRATQPSLAGCTEAS